jgi:hypothetical protein
MSIAMSMPGRALLSIVVPTAPINVGMTTATATNQRLIALGLPKDKKRRAGYDMLSVADAASP